MTRVQMYKVLVTGGSRGIGKAISEVFTDNGYDVCAPDRNELDLTSKESIGSFICNNPDGFDVIINNAGINPLNLIENAEEKDIDDTVMVNLSAPILLVKGFVPMMKERRSGRIVNIGSMWSVVSKPKRSVYSATKHGIHGLTMALTAELSEFGILANTVSPGYTLTDMIKRNNTPEEIEKMGKEIPLGRMAAPEEIAKVVFFLGSYG
ncbi:MAG: SDR family oxidoreductase, partial [Methanomassiliicoccaceae archaeon]|nr:SDR family oxidoreductase [Methanomassiliicoccaceae archaeon]